MTMVEQFKRYIQKRLARYVRGYFKKHSDVKLVRQGSEWEKAKERYFSKFGISS